MMIIFLDEQTIEIKQTTTDCAPCDLLEHLKNQSLYPKVYWFDRKKEVERISWGSSLLRTSVPKRIQAPDELLFFFQKRFQANKQISSPWRDLPQELFFLPKHFIEKKIGKMRYSLNIGSEQQSYLPPTLSSIPILRAMRKRIDTPTKKKWDELVLDCLDKITQNQLQKVVLSRQSHFTLPDTLCPYTVVGHLKKKQKNTEIFFIQYSDEIAFVGATPEKLFKIEGGILTTEALAGTKLASEKIGCKEMKKLHKEVRWVEGYLEEILTHYAQNISKDPTFSLVNVGHICHLYKKISATLTEKHSYADLLSALHPTPAVAGYTKSQALDYIHKHESHDRGFYAGPIGWLTGNLSDVSVALRSSLIRKNEAFVYSGAGIVEGSCPDREWQELDNKIAQYKEFFCG